MPKRSKELSALEVKRLKEPGFHSVGGVPGLHLRINDGGGRSWILRAVTNGKRRDIGLGGFPDVSLAAARESARIMRESIKGGVDPVIERAEDRKKQAEQKAQSVTFGDVVTMFLVSGKLDGLQNAKHRAQWGSTLNTYAVPLIGTKSIQDIDVKDVMSVLSPIWTSIPETADRLRARIEAVFAWAIANGHRSRGNPAIWKGNLKDLLPAHSKLEKPRPAISLQDAHAWFSVLRTREGLAAKALEFLTLTAARSSEVRFATWDEIHTDQSIWIVPAERMKMRREHRVPLSKAAVDLLNALPRMQGTNLIFPGLKNAAMSDATLLAVMKRMHALSVKEDGKGWIDPVQGVPAVPHGLRSTFRDWVAEKTIFASDMAEVALAHRVGSAVERAYRRGDMVEKRREMMEAWAAFLTAKSATSAGPDAELIEPAPTDSQVTP